jgi:hypothetical protein
VKAKGVALRALQQFVYGQDDRISALEGRIDELANTLTFALARLSSAEAELLRHKSTPAPYTSPTIWPNTPWVSPTIWSSTGLPLNVCIFGSSPDSPEDLARRVQETYVQIKHRRKP